MVRDLQQLAFPRGSLILRRRLRVNRTLHIGTDWSFGHSDVKNKSRISRMSESPQDLEELENHMNDKNGEKRHVMSLPTYGILGCFIYILDCQRLYINFLFKQLGEFICGQLQPHRCALSQKKRNEAV
ncbi:unnamed protein product [Musa textilis]